MKSYVGFLAILATFINPAVGLGTSEGHCNSDASVYLLNSDTSASAHHKHSNSANSEPLLSLQQAQYVLSDFSGVSKSLEINSQDNARAVAAFRSNVFGKASSSSQDSSILIITIENFSEENSYLVGKQPAFKIGKCSDGAAVKKAVASLSSLIGDVTGKLKQSWSQSLHIFSDDDDAGKIVKRLTVDDLYMDDQFDASLPEDFDFLTDIANLMTFEQNLVPNEHILVHIESLKGLGDKKLEIATQYLINTLRGLAEKKEFAKIALITTPDSDEECVYQGDIIDLSSRKHDNGGHKFTRQAKPATAAGKNKKRLLPPFNSEDDCLTGTDSCSGRGTCLKTSLGPYECVCSSTYNSTKKQTTYWAGNACEKKDVSAETQLFLWTGVGIVVILVWSTKLLFSISSDPLPGVLGATKDS